MPLRSPSSTPISQRVSAAHVDAIGIAPTHIASAPATWAFIGEHVDYFGGVVIAGLSDLRAAVAVSARNDGTINVSYTCSADSDSPQEDSITLMQLAELAAAQQLDTDSEGLTVYPDPPAGGMAARWGGVVHTMINRQLLSRDTAGFDITVVSDIPCNAGLGAYSAVDVALALALVGEDSELKDAPVRARIADVCTQAAGCFSAIPPVHARHSSALRGAEDAVTIVDYADGSVTHAPHPVTQEVQAYAITAPQDFDAVEAGAELRRRERFIDAACHAFGTESLRMLPDAPQRVIDWLQAVHKVYGAQGQPSIAEATQWLAFYEEETQRAKEFASALRSRRGAALFPLLEQSQGGLNGVYDLGAAPHLAQLAMSRGALAARCAFAGVFNSVIAYVPAKNALNFAADLAGDRLAVCALNPGAPAVLEA